MPAKKSKEAKQKEIEEVSVSEQTDVIIPFEDRISDNWSAENHFDPVERDLNELFASEDLESNELPLQEKEFKEIEEITLKFGKGFVRDPFTAKDGREYRSILIPNRDPEDHSPWASFIVRANAVHEDKFGKGMWTKIPKEGYTTIKRGVVIGQDENGKRLYENRMSKVSNLELKSMVEFYKERPRESVKEKLTEKQEEVKAAKPPAQKSVAKEEVVAI